MAYSKSEFFNREDEQLADIAKALSHPARIAILKVLAARQTCICGEIVDELPLSQSTVSQHLKALKQANLIIGEIDGPRMCYCLNESICKKARSMLNSLFNKIKCC
ncbi:MAG: winged helix-turn-helix transcriptional regulator [Saprospiraceae bacterium]|nr:winged helix-turn-helix transcriptional regulator [Saprospiraceae bacterium]